MKQNSRIGYFFKTKMLFVLFVIILTNAAYITQNTTSKRHSIIFPLDKAMVRPSTYFDYKVVISPMTYTFYKSRSLYNVCTTPLPFGKWNSSLENPCQNYFCNLEAPNYLNLTGTERSKMQIHHYSIMNYCTLCSETASENITSFNNCTWYDKGFCKGICEESNVCFYMNTTTTQEGYFCYSSQKDTFYYRDDPIHNYVTPIFFYYGPSFITFISHIISLTLLILLNLIPSLFYTCRSLKTPELSWKGKFKLIFSFLHLKIGIIIINSIVQIILSLIDIINFSPERRITQGFPIVFIAILLVFGLILINWSEILYYADNLNDDICLSKRSIIIVILSSLGIGLTILFLIIAFALLTVLGRYSLPFIITFFITFSLLVLTILVLLTFIIIYSIKIIIELRLNKENIFKMKFTQSVCVISVFLFFGVFILIFTFFSTVLGGDLYHQIGSFVLYFITTIYCCIFDYVFIFAFLNISWIKSIFVKQ